jgi:hypothetical protein
MATLLSLALAACGGTAANSPGTARPSPTATPSPTTSAPGTPSASAAPDDEQVEVVASGFGAYDLQVYPVVVLQNLATAHTATAVVVSFTVRFSGGSYALSAEPVSIAPGETLADTVLCTDSCVGATGSSATVTVGGWTAGDHPVISGSSGSFACGSPCPGNPGYQGNVTGTLSGQVPSGTLLDVSAVCMDSGGAIVGGGLQPRFWPGGTSAAESVPVEVRATPASCQLYATESS